MVTRNIFESIDLCCSLHIYILYHAATTLDKISPKTFEIKLGFNRWKIDSSNLGRQKHLKCTNVAMNFDSMLI